MEKKIYLLQQLKWRILTLLFASLLFSTTIFSQAPTNGLMLYYDFEALDGVTVTDGSGNAKNGTVTGAAVIATGKVGNGLNFPTAATPAAQYVTLPVGITGSLTDFTIATWVKVDNMVNWQRIFDFGENSANNMFISPQSGGGNLRYAIKVADAGEQQINAPGALPVGKWAHVAVTCAFVDGVGVGNLYLDGALVGTNTNMTFTPAMMDAALGAPTNNNFLAKSQYNDPGFVGTLDEFRIYNRALSSTEVMQTIGYPAELITQYEALTLGDLTAVTSNITLPTTLGTGGVTIAWASSNPVVIATNGTVTQPDKFNATVKLTATLKLGSDSILKEFTATVLAANPAPPLLAKWTFPTDNIFLDNGTVKVTDESENAYVGSIKNVAKIRTIGESSRINVLDLGNSNGYFDMDTLIGKAIYSLTNYTVGAYYYIDEAYTDICNNCWGNCLWSFSNNTAQGSGGNGVMFTSLVYQGNIVTPTGYGSEHGPRLNVVAPKGVWKHIAFTQDGDSGRLYVDGERVAAVKDALTPSVALSLAGRTGTRYNTIGVPAYTNDRYLRQTLVYGFELYNEPLTADDLKADDICDVDGTLAKLNTAYGENPNVVFPELTIEWDNLTLGDLSAVTSNLYFPTKGTDQTITIAWKTNSGVIGSTGIVTRPDYLDATVKITATLFKAGQTLTKEFIATVLAKPGTEYASDLLLNYDFANNRINGISVTDASEKQFGGTLMKGADVKVLGTSTPYNVLNLGTDSAYFDMGQECGKLIYGLKDYSISVFFRIDETKTNLANNGNFLYAFSNSPLSNIDRNGYMFGRASVGIHCVASEYWASGNMATPNGTTPSLGTFHHFLFTQKDTIGTAYLDGLIVGSEVSFKNLPSLAIPKANLFGTNYNYLGRPNFGGDAYLSKAMLYDFKLYKKTLPVDDIIALQGMVNNLNVAYTEGISTSINIKGNNKLRVSTSIPGLIQILGATGKENVKVFDLYGRQIAVKDIRAIHVKRGMYVVKADNLVTKVLVK